MSPELLTRLLRGEHVGMEERLRLGAWPHGALRFGDLVAHVAAAIRAEPSFPRRWEEAAPGEAVHEGGVIERQGPDLFCYRTQRAHPVQPTVVAEQVERIFNSAEEAARHYLKWDLGLPGDLDGWKVVE
jgi:hypothetical protein